MDWSAFFSTFGLVFVAELGDKTQLAVMTQTCKFRTAWPVFLGASLALTAVTAVGAVGGRLLGVLIPPGVMRLIAALAFVIMGALILRETFRARMNSDADAACGCDIDPELAPVRPSRWNWKAFGSTLTLLFVAELGDKTQLAVLSLTSKLPTPWAVFAGGALALIVVTGLGVLGGEGLCRLIPERILLRISAVAFLVMGALIGLGVF